MESVLLKVRRTFPPVRVTSYHSLLLATVVIFVTVFYIQMTFILFFPMEASFDDREGFIEVENALVSLYTTGGILNNTTHSDVKGVKNDTNIKRNAVNIHMSALYLRNSSQYLQRSPSYNRTLQNLTLDSLKRNGSNKSVQNDSHVEILFRVNGRGSGNVSNGSGNSTVVQLPFNVKKDTSLNSSKAISAETDLYKTTKFGSPLLPASNISRFYVGNNNTYQDMKQFHRNITHSQKPNLRPTESRGPNYCPLWPEELVFVTADTNDSRREKKYLAFATSMDPDEPASGYMLFTIRPYKYCRNLKRTAWILMRLCGCAGLSGSVLVANEPVGPMQVDQLISRTEIPKANRRWIKEGGRFQPPDCIPREKTAIIIPYRDRQTHLLVLLRHLHTVLQRQKIEYGIYVIEMAYPTQFNRGLLANVGFLTASSIAPYTCYIIHDVDLLMQDDRNMYRCGRVPRHLTASNTKYHNKLPYPDYFGGVVAFTPEQFLKVNGFSNLYFGWGGEDDDMARRINFMKQRFSRSRQQIGGYVAIDHENDSANPKNPHSWTLLKSAGRRMFEDGVRSVSYNRLALEFKPLYTWAYITAKEAKIMQKYQRYLDDEWYGGNVAIDDI